ncbi:protein translocase subunit SecD [Candidatus Photodesmus blepharus]|uniref:Protein translocase subunit SecD n=1 Tax=Candidatus Photodesmus blepharonis TaxID=1179155 RepID=A0A084CPD1_9GAMM|nr:protein translocase subunit SecD [Candidatus Photodesmus blepharus]KEY91660.1 protein translocase subunit SecD [Candidatus Photodesmus blepharus]
MLNGYPLWKYLAVILIIATAALYALPNVYGEDPAIQVKGTRGASLDASTLDSIISALHKENISYKSAVLQNGIILIRFFNDTDSQINAQDIIKEVLDKDKIIALSFASAAPKWLEVIGAKPMKLGLDLRGGVHFLLEVDMNDVVGKFVAHRVEELRVELRKKKIHYRAVRSFLSSNSIEVLLRNNKQLIQVKQLLKFKYPDMSFIESNIGRNLKLTSTFSESRLEEIRNYAVKQNIIILRKRVNELGVAEPLVYRQGVNRIVVELPGLQNIAHAKEILGATATLEFREVDEQTNLVSNPRASVPLGSDIRQDRYGYPVALKKRVILDGSSITDATSSFDEYGRPQVNISLNQKGGSKMLAFSRRNIGRKIATVFIEYRQDTSEKNALIKNEEVINQAIVQSVLGRNFRITGISSILEAQNLALLLRAGTLIAPISIVQERTIGPSMGEKNIDMGVMACIWGMMSVMLFTLVYYRQFGLIANVALIVNLILIIGIMSILPGATMTLPGIAGIVLTIGMAIDANVLIFERIREELFEGYNPQQAIHRGYLNAFGTIVDANITSLIAAVILFVVGTGAIKGFAVTLSIGLLTSMFTSIIGTRCVVNLLYSRKRMHRLSI